MNSATRFTLLVALLSLSACQKDAPATPPAAANPPPVAANPPPDTTVALVPEAAADCTDCRWELFLNKALTVPTIECTNAGPGTPCHLVTEGGVPIRQVIVMHDQATDGYRFLLYSTAPDQQANRMECLNLVRDTDNPRAIRGTCVINNSDTDGNVHHFLATLQKRIDAPSKAEIKFEFRHKKFDNTPDPVHNGEGHAHIP